MSREVAEAFGAEPELLADCDQLGGWPDKIVAAEAIWLLRRAQAWRMSWAVD